MGLKEIREKALQRAELQKQRIQQDLNAQVSGARQQVAGARKKVLGHPEQQMEQFHPANVANVARERAAQLRQQQLDQIAQQHGYQNYSDFVTSGGIRGHAERFIQERRDGLAQQHGYQDEGDFHAQGGIVGHAQRTGQEMVQNYRDQRAQGKGYQGHQDYKDQGGLPSHLQRQARGYVEERVQEAKDNVSDAVADARWRMRPGNVARKIFGRPIPERPLYQPKRGGQRGGSQGNP